MVRNPSGSLLNINGITNFPSLQLKVVCYAFIFSVVFQYFICSVGAFGKIWLQSGSCVLLLHYIAICITIVLPSVWQMYYQ